MAKQQRGTKMIYDRGEAAKSILEYIKAHKGVTKGKLEKKFSRSTVWYNIYRHKGALKEKIRIIKKPSPSGKKIDAFIVKEEMGDISRINNDYIDFLIREFIEAEKNLSNVQKNTKLKYVINEMEQLCFNKKIQNEKFINFILEKACDPQYLMVSSTHRTWNCIQILAQHLNQDIQKKKYNDSEIEKRLLNKIRSTCINHLEKIVFNKEIIPEVRVDALDTIVGIDFEHSFNVAVNLLMRLNTQKSLSFAPWDTHQVTEFSAFIALIGYIISSFAQQNQKNWVECRKKLFNLLDANSDKITKHEIQNLWELTALENKIRPVAVTPRKLSHANKHARTTSHHSLRSL